MSKWGLTYKTFEVLWPDEWNTLIDALDDLCKWLVIFIPACGSDMVFDYGNEKAVLPFRAEIDPLYPFILPIDAKIKVIIVHVYENTLNADSYIYVRKNKLLTDLSVKIDAEHIGMAYNIVDGVDFEIGDGVDFLVDTKDATSGVLKISNICAVGILTTPVRWL